MELKNLNAYFLFAILIAVSVAAFILLQPFLTAILTAAILVIIFQSPFRFFLSLTKNRIGLSSFLTSLLIISIIILPLCGVFILLANEATALINYISSDGRSISSVIANVQGSIQKIPLFQSVAINKLFQQKELVDIAKSFSQFSLVIIQRTYQEISHFIFWLFVVFFTLYYFLMDGKKIVGRIMALSPLRNSHETVIVEKFSSIVKATLKGTVVIAIVQGMLGTITLIIAGVSSPIVWGVLMAVFSVIPMVGSGLVWFPAGIILLLTGKIWQGIFILTAGFGLISTIDNILRPKLVGQDTQMHPLLIFFSTLGGIAAFGFIGFILGPIIMALFLTLLDIYALEFKTQLKEYNH